MRRRSGTRRTRCLWYPQIHEVRGYTLPGCNVREVGFRRLQDVRGNTTPSWQGDPLRVPVASPRPAREVEESSRTDSRRAHYANFVCMRSRQSGRGACPSNRFAPDFDYPARGEASGRQGEKRTPELSRAHPRSKKRAFRASRRQRQARQLQTCGKNVTREFHQTERHATVDETVKSNDWQPHERTGHIYPWRGREGRSPEQKHPIESDQIRALKLHEPGGRGIPDCGIRTVPGVSGQQ
jgi:hypothetical protein